MPRVALLGVRYADVLEWRRRQARMHGHADRGCPSILTLLRPRDRKPLFASLGRGGELPGAREAHHVGRACAHGWRRRDRAVDRSAPALRVVPPASGPDRAEARRGGDGAKPRLPLRRGRDTGLEGCPNRPAGRAGTPPRRTPWKIGPSNGACAAITAYQPAGLLHNEPRAVDVTATLEHRVNEPTRPAPLARYAPSPVPAQLVPCRSPGGRWWPTRYD